MTRILDYVKVKGKNESVMNYEVYGRTTEKSSISQGENQETIVNQKSKAKSEQYYRAYHQAFEAYLKKNFKEAGVLFSKASTLYPDDMASIEMLKRIQSIRGNTVVPGWDGSVVLSSK